MPPPAEPTPDTLLQDARWVHSIAASLVTDPGDADDLTQEAAVAVLRSPPRRSTNIKGWLQTVMRNALKQRHRGEARRVRREAAIADDIQTSAEPADLVVERAMLRKQVAEAALALAEPYRTAILMRFFEAMTPKQIARARQLPVATVHTHLRRGLELLRTRLDQVVDDTMDWRAILMVAPATSPLMKLVLSTLLAASLGVGGYALYDTVSVSEDEQARAEVGEGQPSLEPTGDALHDELRRLAAEAPIDELMEQHMNLLYYTPSRYSTDPILWGGVERVCQEVLSNPRNPHVESRRKLAGWLITVISKNDPKQTGDLRRHLTELSRITSRSK